MYERVLKCIVIVLILYIITIIYVMHLGPIQSSPFPFNSHSCNFQGIVIQEEDGPGPAQGTEIESMRDIGGIEAGPDPHTRQGLVPIPERGRDIEGTGVMTGTDEGQGVYNDKKMRSYLSFPLP